ncbi:MAG: TIR domain-containing protein [Bacteroidota bacterium]|nr:TIR domain-containing protein [Bacteroidota bacterium]
MLKLFISYCHKDEFLVSKYINHITPLESNGLISVWYDRKINTGDDYQNIIDENLDNADIICLMISDNFLASKACLSEKDEALNLKIRKGIRVIPIILSHCAWKEHSELNILLATPTDGNPITSLNDQNLGWLDTVNCVKNVSNSINLIKGLKIKEEFNNFLNNADILSKAHSSKENLLLEDVFIYPSLKSYDEKEVSHKFNSELFNDEILKFNKIIIAGENQSGKTTLCKKLFQILRNLNHVPIYFIDDNEYIGFTTKNLENAFYEQYDFHSFGDIDKKRIVPILDNFHYAKNQEKYIEKLEEFNKQILIVDDIFGLNIKKQNLINDYKKFKIREFTAIERNELIKKWIFLKKESQDITNQNDLQQILDEKTELIENSLGIIFGKGIMPSYPFFILSVLSAQDIQKPLDSEITSQGHCYQALIYLYLRKHGVKNDQIDIYTNFLTELAYWIFEKNTLSIDKSEFNNFKEYYKEKFNVPIPISDIERTLSSVNICKLDSLNQFNFCYSYIYYFFVAKYLSEHLDNKKNVINKIISNLDKDENAYITIFISHHTKSNVILDELLLNAEMLFEKDQPATLNKLELSFFDLHQDKIIKAVMPSFNHNSNDERKKLLEIRVENEEKLNQNSSSDENIENNELENNELERIELEKEDIENDNFAKELRLSIKTVEVMGSIIKNRSGSLDKEKLEYIFEQGYNVHMRVLKSFINLIDNEKNEKELIGFLIDRLKLVIKENEELENKEMRIEKIEKIARDIYWNMNFGVLHGFISKAIHSLGSSNLLNISQSISDKVKSPSAFIVNHGIKMWYSKSLKIDEIYERIKKEDFSKTAENLIKTKIVEHCRMHKIDFKDAQKIEQKLNISSKKMLVEREQNKKEKQN